MKKILKAPAKINLYLSVNSKRVDGYHDLTMIMQPISLFDTIEFEILNQFDLKSSFNNTIKQKYDKQINLISNLSFIPTDDKNLIVKVIKYFFEKYNIKDRIFIYLKKLIPTCGGLGGGSSDAASVLLFLNEHYKTNLSLEEMNDISCLFGSDISFFLYKNECICEGRGEKITLLPSFKKYYILISTPNLRVSTKDIFNKLDNFYVKKENNINKNKMFDNCVKAIKNNDLKLLSQNLYNDLEYVTCELYEVISSIKDYILENGAISALMSGSGPTVFGIFDSYFKALKAKSKVKSMFVDAFTFIARPIY